MNDQPTALTAEQLDEIEARATAATRGPWRQDDFAEIKSPDGDTIADYWEPTHDSENGAFIAHARTDVPALLAEVRRLRAVPTAVPSVPTDRAARSERYARAIRAAGDTAYGNRPFYKAITDAVIAIADAEQAELRRERDLAIAHDRQPYPTAWAYEQACKALRRKDAAIDRVRQLHDSLDAETDLTSPDDEITRGAAARKIAAALDGYTPPASGPSRVADGAQQGPARPPSPQCGTCNHPKRDHDGRADHRAKSSPLVAGDPWCHACIAPCDYSDQTTAAELRRMANEAQPAEEPTVGSRCGNNPNARPTPGDRQAVKEFREYLARRRAGGPPEQNPFTTSEEA